MDRRKSLKALAVGSIATTVFVEACKPNENKESANKSSPAPDESRMKEEIEYNQEIAAKHFFTKDEMVVITILADIIIPKDEVSGSASDAKVPEFIDYIVNDMPEHQVPMRGGLRWLDMLCLKSFDKSFVDCNVKQRLELINEIAFPDKAKPEMNQGVSFFNLMRNLTATGFYSTEIGWNDMGYMGNKPAQWNGVPDDVLKQYGLSYTEKELKECVSFSS